MFWQITSYPTCGFHVFLSHCAEDRAWLVIPVYEELIRRGIIPWLDRHDYYYGRDSRVALRDGLLRCRHSIFFITLAMMEHRRGWCAMELAYSNLLRDNFVRSGGPLMNYELPLFLLDPADARIPRSCWNKSRDIGVFLQEPKADPVKWACDQIQAFLRREQLLALDLAKASKSSKSLRNEIQLCSGLERRVTRFDPVPVP